MAVDTPESLVFRGHEGSGAAQVFGHPYDVVGMYRQGEAEKRRRADIQAAMQYQQRQARDKKIGDLLLTNPEKTFEPFNKQIIGDAEQHRQSLVKMFDEGVNPDSAAFKAYNTKKWEDINDKARRGNFIKSQIALKRQEIASNKKYLDTDLLDSKLNDTYMDHEGNGHPLEKVDMNAIDKVVDNNPEAFKADAYADDFLKNLGDKVFNYNQQMRDSEGVTTKDVDIKMKKDIYQPDPNAVDGIKRDPRTGNPIINITPEVIRGFKSDRYAGNYVNHIANTTGKSEKEVIEDILSPKLDVDKKQTMNFKFNPGSYRNAYGLKQGEEQKATRRLQNVSTLADAFVDDEGYLSDKPNKKAEELLGYLKGNAKFGAADIVDAHLVKGDSESGTQDINGVRVDNKPYDRIILTTKQGVRGRPKVQEIDLSNKRSATAELNSVFETAKTEGGFRVGHDILRNLDEEKFGNQYLSSNRKIREGTMDEKAMLNEVTKWGHGENLNTLVGKKLDDKKIIGVSHRKALLGSDYLEIKTADGEITKIKTGDTEGLQKLKNVYASGFKEKVKLAGDKAKDELESIFEEND